MAKKKLKVPERGNMYITTTFNNIIITTTDKQGNAVAWSSAGKVGFTNTKKKNTPGAAKQVAEDCVKKVRQSGMKEVDVFVSGVGPGREAALKSIGQEVKIISISDRTPIAHNGCRAAKRKRV